MKKGWSQRTLGELTVNFDSQRVPVKELERKAGPYPYYGASGVVDHVQDYLFDGEYLLIAEDGENLRSRTTPIAFMARGKFWVNNHAHIVRGNDAADTRFLAYAIQNTDISGYLTGSTIPKLSQGSLNRIELSIPSLEEQREIAAILGALDDKIELNRRMNGTLEALAQAVFKEWFVENTEEGWEEVPFGDLIEASVGGDWGQEKPDDEHTERVSIIRGADFPAVQNQSKEKVPVRYVTAAKLKTRALKPGDLVIEISGGTKDRPTGRCVQVTENMLNWFDEPVVAASFCRLIRPKAGLSNYLALHMDHIYRQGKTWMYQNVSTGLSNFQMKEFLAKETLPLPPSDLLEEFNTIIDPITAKRTTSESQTLTALRDTLLPKLMRGEVRVRALSRRPV